ncbi:unnamed protein product [Lupinus luteus]|uniref:RING-type domain-containing protein n=1 Tax=Lupinus luteus TaxID=3873 RepID=A0AAV1VRQ5_LUPLU
MNKNNHTQFQSEFLYQIIHTGSVEAIKTLHINGASLECSDEEGRTPLILACMDSALLHVAKFLIHLGANLNSYRPGPFGGTPLHHAARRGLEQTVELLLSHKANALVRNDNNQTPLDVARSERHAHVVRAIENHICYFKGWMREFHGPWFLEAVTPQLVSRNVWVVVVPYSEEPLKLEMMIYPTQQDSQPRTVIDLWKSEIEEPAFDHWDPKLTIFNHFPRTKYRLASAIQNDKQQLQNLYTASCGIPQVKSSPTLSDTRTSSLGPSVQSETINTNGWGSSSDNSSYNGWGTSLGARHSLKKNTNGWMDKPFKNDQNGWGSPDSKPVEQSTKNNLGSSSDSSYNGWGTSLGARHSSELNTNGWMDKPAKDDYNGWGSLDSKPVDQLTDNVQSRDDNSPIVSSASCSFASSHFVPSAPPIPDDVLSEGQLHYPSIHSPALDMHVPSMVEPAMSIGKNKGARDSSCAICWDAAIEGACIPCGHMAGCMPCLNEVRVNKGVCPICMTKIDQVVRLYAV